MANLILLDKVLPLVFHKSTTKITSLKCILELIKIISMDME
jgi:hypothetical protein